MRYLLSLPFLYEITQPMTTMINTPHVIDVTIIPAMSPAYLLSLLMLKGSRAVSKYQKFKISESGTEITMMVMYSFFVNIYVFL